MRTYRYLIAGAVAVAGLAGAGVAAASDVYWSVGVQAAPGVVVSAGNARPVYVAPRPYYRPAPPVYYSAPAPVYYAPPPPVYYQPRPIYYSPPVVVRPGPPHWHHGRGHGRGHWR
jgi:hypothetical protein